MVKSGKYNDHKSTRKDKKLMTVFEKDGKVKIVHFGSSVNQHYKDKTGIWKSLDHKDKKRRQNYLLRSAAIKDGKGNLTMNNPLSGNFHARRILW